MGLRMETVAGAWARGFFLEWALKTGVLSVCQENHFASDLLVGAGETVDRASRIVP